MSTAQMHPDAHPVDEDLVRRLIAGQFPRWADLPVERLPSPGTVNVMYRLGDDMVIRLPMLAGGAEDVAMEGSGCPGWRPDCPRPFRKSSGPGSPPRGIRGRGRC